MFNSKFIVIIDPPGRAFLQKDVETVIKGESITLTCVVEELGRPAATEYIWRLGGKVINDVKSLNWTIDPVTLETEGNISCHQYNMSFSGFTKLLNKKDKNRTKYNPSYDLIYSHNPLGKLSMIFRSISFK